MHAADHTSAFGPAPYPLRRPNAFMEPDWLVAVTTSGALINSVPFDALQY